MNTKPLTESDWQLIAKYQKQLDEIRLRLNIKAPGIVLFRSDIGYGDDKEVWVEADGMGGAILRVVEGKYPTDFYTHEEKKFLTEAEALRAAEAFCTVVA